MLGHHRHRPGYPRIMFNDFTRAASGGDPVIKLPRGTRSPLGEVLTKRDRADRWIVPEKAVTSARNGKGDTRLRISLRQFQHAALVVEKPVLITTHSVDLLVV